MPNQLRPVPSYLLLSLSCRTRLKGVQERHARYGDGAWWKTAFAVVPDSRLYAENVFECLAAVPHTTFVARRAAAYAPG